MHAYIQRIIIYDKQDMEGTYMPIDRWMDKEDAAHARMCTHTRILLVLKKNESIWDNMGEPRGCYTKWSKSEKDNCMILPLWNLKTDP